MSTVITDAYRLPGTTSVPALARALSTNTADARREAVLVDIATVVRVMMDNTTEPVRAALDILAYPLTVKQFSERPGVRAALLRATAKTAARRGFRDYPANVR